MHACLKIEFTEGDKCHNLMSWFISSLWEETFEPAHEIVALIALRKLNLQTRMPSHPMGLHVWFSVRSFIYFYSLCVRSVKALARLRICAVSPEPLPFAYAISTIISWAGSFFTRWTRNIRNTKVLSFTLPKMFNIISQLKFYVRSWSVIKI